ncbi:AI-2E family transporter [Nocardioides sp. B-3]|uniref:AI-2E family transporter n=1 Tax=Nocardioides sp. B-3 TaxID=2895565 RepID=UPI0021520C1D|nr:AI-2E family transporter [Nocardioides sp. B-3]
MFGGVIPVQQIEGHILQPFLMGRFVSVHPLGVIVAIGCGVLVAGIAGALIAVPPRRGGQRRRQPPRPPEHERARGLRVTGDDRRRGSKSGGRGAE